MTVLMFSEDYARPQYEIEPRKRDITGDFISTASARVATFFIARFLVTFYFTT